MTTTMQVNHLAGGANPLIQTLLTGFEKAPPSLRTDKLVLLPTHIIAETDGVDLIAILMQQALDNRHASRFQVLQ